MAFQPLSVGDILMLSQTAWKIGRAFTQGKKSAPSEFAEVEREANSLSEALKLVAEALHDPDGSVLTKADAETKAAVNTILESAHKTLSDLESFVERYQVIKKKETGSGFMVERTWSDAVLANYKTFKWTTEGGNLNDLRNMLQVHASTINLTMQALQSRSLTRLEKTVVPMAENVAQIHDRLSGELSEKIDDVHRFVMAFSSGVSPALTPLAQPEQPQIEYSSRSGRSSEATSPIPGPSRTLDLPPPRSSSYYRPSSSHSNSVPPPPRSHADSAYYSLTPASFDQGRRKNNRIDLHFESGSPPEDGASIGGAERFAGLRDSSSRESSSSSGERSKQRQHIGRPESATLGQLIGPSMTPVLQQNRNGDAHAGRHRSVAGSSTSSRPQTARSSTLSRYPTLPSPAIPPELPSVVQAPATPRSILSSPKSRPKSSATSRLSLNSQPPRQEKDGDSDDATSVKQPSIKQPAQIQDPAFQSYLIRNAAILCDVRGSLLEFAQKIPDEPDPRFDTEMVAACEESRICVIRKRENREHGGTRVSTSVWTLAADGEARIQQKLPELSETVPFCSYFQPEKVSLQPTPEEGEVQLKFHSKIWGGELQDIKKTNWVNYIFQSQTDALAFQSAIFGRMLIGSYRTTKTTVIHDGFKGAFAFEEQFANIEMLRLWEDDGITTPGAAGGVLALMHVSSNFGEGWARFWVNNSSAPCKIKEEGSKYARVKGINLSIVRPGALAAANRLRSPSLTPGNDSDSYFEVASIASPRSPGGGVVMGRDKKGPIKKVTGIRIEFKSEAERDGFVSVARRMQARAVALPDL